MLFSKIVFHKKAVNDLRREQVLKIVILLPVIKKGCKNERFFDFKNNGFAQNIRQEE